jgi:hypothetical protein
MTVYVGAIIRNGSKTLPKFKQFLQQLHISLPTLNVCMYEDGSTDTTKEDLQVIVSELSFVTVKSETFDWLKKSTVRTWDNKPCRMECISFARNQLMDMLEEQGMGLHPTDVCIMIDPDIPSQLSVEYIVQLCTRYPEDADGIFCKGVSMYSGAYYDSFAYRDAQFPYATDVYGEQNMDYARIKEQYIRRLSNLTEKKSVFSAFGGLAIYRGKAIKGKRYSAFPTPELNTLYQLHRVTLPENSEVVLVEKVRREPQTHFHGCLLGSYLFDTKESGGLFYFCCSGYNFPIVCEHVTFHAAMILDGYDRLYIDPNLQYVSDHY